MDDSPRGRLVEELTDALGRMLLAGDIERSQVALPALGDLARLADKYGPDGSTSDVAEAGFDVVLRKRLVESYCLRRPGAHGLS